MTWIGTRLRRENIDECRRFGVDPVEYLHSVFEFSSYAKIAVLELPDGRQDPMAIWGVADFALATPRGSGWAFMTDLAEEYWRFVARASRYFLREMLERYDTVQVLADLEYKRALRWLSWLGFEFSCEQPLGPNGELFVVATARRD